MTSELDLFLADLRGRRERLLQLVQPADDTHGALLDELTELGEQLIIAEEELRVQQEELVDASRRAEQLLREREELRTSSIHPYVVTDGRGVVLRANPAAEHLIRQPAIRATPRPIATWFEVADRPTVRSMISSVVSGREGHAEARAVIRRADRSIVPVRVSLHASIGSGRLELQWELDVEPAADPSVAGPPAKLELVPEQGPEASRPDTDQELAANLTSLAVELADCEDEEHLLAVGVKRTKQLIPGVDHAGVLLLRRRGAMVSDVSADELVLACDRQQLMLREGPALIALVERAPVIVADIADESQWPAFAAAAAELGVRSILAIDVSAGETVLGVLSLYAERTDAFDESAVGLASLLACQLGVALNQLRTVRNLRAGMANRELIGEAIGVLIERRRITSRQAFQLLVQASQHNNIKLHDIARIVTETGLDPSQIRPR